MFTVNFCEQTPGCSFKVLNQQDVTMAGRSYQRRSHSPGFAPHRAKGRFPSNAARPRVARAGSASSRTPARISPPNAREIERWRYFGYEGFTGDKDSPIRLACQLKATGNVTLAIHRGTGRSANWTKKKPRPLEL